VPPLPPPIPPQPCLTGNGSSGDGGAPHVGPAFRFDYSRDQGGPARGSPAPLPAPPGAPPAAAADASALMPPPRRPASGGGGGEGGDEPFVAPFEVPDSLVGALPATLKEHRLIAQTAGFVRHNGGQAAVVLRARMAGNPVFGFLYPSGRMHPYFKWLVADGAPAPLRAAAAAADAAPGGMAAGAAAGAARGTGLAAALQVFAAPAAPAAGAASGEPGGRLRGPASMLQPPQQGQEGEKEDEGGGEASGSGSAGEAAVPEALALLRSYSIASEASSEDGGTPRAFGPELPPLAALAPPWVAGQQGQGAGAAEQHGDEARQQAEPEEAGGVEEVAAAMQEEEAADKVQEAEGCEAEEYAGGGQERPPSLAARDPSAAAGPDGGEVAHEEGAEAATRPRHRPVSAGDSRGSSDSAHGSSGSSEGGTVSDGAGAGAAAEAGVHAAAEATAGAGAAERAAAGEAGGAEDGAPPEDARAVIDKLAAFVERNGAAFEVRVYACVRV
jgi:hypothetical protein